LSFGLVGQASRPAVSDGLEVIVKDDVILGQDKPAVVSDRTMVTDRECIGDAPRHIPTLACSSHLGNDLPEAIVESRT
jgi:hypothetical protein